jgi:SulP family sulfate permease
LVSVRRNGRSIASALKSLPVLVSLRGYRRDWLRDDALAALTLLAIAVPSQLATSRLADMPPVTGLYAFVAGTIMFALLGRNPQMSIGADSTIAPLFAVGVAHLASTGSPHYIALVALLAVVTGVLVALVGVLRLGWIAEFLSTPIITGFLAGVAVIIIAHQLSDLLGVPAGSGSTVHRLTSLISHLQMINGWTLAIGIGVLVTIVAGLRIDRRAPGALIGVVGSTILVAVLGLRAHGVAVLGTIAHTTPRVGISGLSWASLGDVLPIAAVVALVIIAQTAATTRSAADQGGYDADVSRDFIGVGAGNILAGLTGAFPVDASPPSTAAVISAGGRTQLATLGAAALVAAILIPAAALLHDVPLAALAAVLIFIAIRIFHLHDFTAVFRFDRWEFALAAITTLTVALIGVEEGIGVAMALAVLDRTRLSARPHAHILGQIPGTTSWEPLDRDQQPTEIPGVLVMLFASPLYFANAGHFRAQIDAGVNRLPTRPRALVLDVVGMHDIDYTGTRALSSLLDELDRNHVTFALARPGRHLVENLGRSGLLQRIGSSQLYSSVGEAVASLGS